MNFLLSKSGIVNIIPIGVMGKEKKSPGKLGTPLWEASKKSWITSGGNSMVDPRKLMKLVATKNKQFGHLTPNQEIFLETLHGTRKNLSRKERRIARAKAREEMFNEKSAYTGVSFNE